MPCLNKACVPHDDEAMEIIEQAVADNRRTVHDVGAR